MQKSSQGSILVILFVATALFLVCVLLLTGGMPQIMNFLLNAGEVSSPVETGPTASYVDLVPIGVEKRFGNLSISVTRVLSPADDFVNSVPNAKRLTAREEYLLVGMKLYCASAAASCGFRQFDFGVTSNTGNDYHPQQPSTFPDLTGIIQGESISPERVADGTFFLFVVLKGDKTMVMYYPTSAGPGHVTRFFLTK